jgi:hypothetical protein
MSSLFPQNVIAVMWDFDKTLSPTYMQDPLFRKFRVDPVSFWYEVEHTIRDYVGSSINVSREAVILDQILRYVRNGKFRGLNNQLLRSLGSRIRFYDGLPDFLWITKNFARRRRDYRLFNITLEHYVVSTGLRQMILGSRIAPVVDDVWGCEFIE